MVNEYACYQTPLPALLSMNIFKLQITSSEAAQEASLSKIPLRRFGKPEEIAAAVAFLVSDDASYITGETIVPAGGTFAHL